MIKDFVKVVRCGSALEFVNALSPTSEHFVDDNPYSWLYRGHSRSSYKLVPTALRDSTSMQHVTVLEAETNERQVQDEFKILRNFFEIADSRGLPLPEDSQQFRALVHKLGQMSVHNFLYGLSAEKISWPPRELLSLMGLVQHYGLPTRLLDWTHDPYIAAFFAAQGVKNSAHKTRIDEDLIKRYCARSEIPFNERAAKIAILGHERTLCVWAFSRSIDLAFQYYPTEPAPYEIVNVPYASNSNIDAQKGLFTVLRVPIDPEEKVDRRSFDDVLGGVSVNRGFESDKVSLFIRFELAWEEAFELLRLLAKLGLSSSSVYPGFKGVCDTVSEKLWWWRRKE